MSSSISKTQPPGGVKLLILIFLAPFLLSSCNVSDTRKLGLVDSKLAPCPSSPNCVSSETSNPEQRVKPFVLTIPPEKAWDLLIDQVSRLPRTTIVTREPRYLHVECRSQLFGFIDDLEFNLRPEQQIVAVRSASRSGYFDFGVNRSRIENLRLTLQKAGVVP